MKREAHIVLYTPFTSQRCGLVLPFIMLVVVSLASAAFAQGQSTGGLGGGDGAAQTGGDSVPQDQDEAPQADGGIGGAPENVEVIVGDGEYAPGQPVDIGDGEISGLDFLRFIAGHTGLAVIFDSGQLAQIDQPITIAHPIRRADFEIVKAILESNGITVRRQTLDNGRTVIKVSSSGGQATPAGVEKHPVLTSDGDEVIVLDDTPIEDLGLNPDELATIVLPVRHREPDDAIKALKELVGGGGGTAAQQKRASGAGFSMVAVEDSNRIIITAKFGMLNYFRKLLSLIDVPIKVPERIVQIVDVENAYADELVSIIDEFLNTRGSSRRSTSRGRTSSSPRTTGTGATPTASRPRTGSNELVTRLIPDQRTNKIIVESYSERELEDVFMLIRELDIRYELRRLKTRIYQVRYLKAVEVADNISQLLGSSSGAGRSGTRDLSSRRSSRSGVRRMGQRSTQRTSTSTAGAGAVPAGQQGPALVVPHEATNSLLIQAEPEEYAEILNILNQIDIKRRQVFLEAALVQVRANSTLNYAIELLAGDPDDETTRLLFASSWGLTGIDFENFNRAIPDTTQGAPEGGLLAVMNRGKFPAIVTFLKTNEDSQVLATPFILADDNMTNLIEILETQFVQTTATGASGVTSTSQEAEDAGVILEITPTISSEQAVFLEMALEVSTFLGSSPVQGVLPPKASNRITSAVTVPDGSIFVIGGLTRELKSKTVSKIPVVGDIPLIGKLFRRESIIDENSNLYIFLRAHVLTHPEFADHLDLSSQARENLERSSPGANLSQFKGSTVPDPPPPPEAPNRPVRWDINPGKARSRRQQQFEIDNSRRYEGDPESPLQTPPVDDKGDGTRPQVRAVPKKSTNQERVNRALNDAGAEMDPDRKSWLLPLRPE